MSFDSELAGVHVGEWLTRARGTRYQKDIAREAGISAQFLCDMELGRRVPTPETARRLSLALGLEADACGKRVVAYYAALYDADGPDDLAERVARMADRFSDCVAEFGADAPSSCSEWREALDGATLAYWAARELPR